LAASPGPVAGRATSRGLREAAAGRGEGGREAAFAAPAPARGWEVAAALGIDSGVDKEAVDGDPLRSDAGGDRRSAFSLSTSLAVIPELC